MKTLMTLREALYYVHGILENYWDTTTRDEGLVMLGSDLNPFQWYDPNEAPGVVSTGDPGTWGDWVAAVRKVTPNEWISSHEALKAMMHLLKEYHEKGWGNLEVQSKSVEIDRGGEYPSY